MPAPDKVPHLPGLALEASGLPEGSLEGGCRGTCGPPPTTLLDSAVLGEEVPDFANAELCPAEEEFYMPLNDG